jgi:hypothetical protein
MTIRKLERPAGTGRETRDFTVRRRSDGEDR